MRNYMRLLAVPLFTLVACTQAAGGTATSRIAATTAARSPAAASTTAQHTASAAVSLAGAATPSALPANTSTAPSPPAATSTLATATQVPATSTVPAATAAATAAPTSPPAVGTTVTAKLVDMAIRLSQGSIGAGTVTFAVTNTGTVQHELVILKTTFPQDQIPLDPTQPGKVLETGAVGRVSSLAPGASGSVTLALAAGAYVLICNEPGHYLAGMHVAFTVNP